MATNTYPVQKPKIDFETDHETVAQLKQMARDKGITVTELMNVISEDAIKKHKHNKNNLTAATVFWRM